MYRRSESTMSSTRSEFAFKRRVACMSLLLTAALCTGCSSQQTKRDNVARGPFTGAAPFSKTVVGSGDAVCWSVKRALLSQGYMLDRSSEPGVLTGSRDYQPQEKLNVTVHLQTTCADNHDGTSMVFATAERDVNKLQKMKQTTSAGIGPATLTMPAGSAKVLGTIRRETISDPAFYNSFFALVQNYVAQEGRSHPDAPTAMRGDPAPRPAMLGDSPPPA